jgi:tRNA nucleotidyltransferase (CCA-adding enzyme)
MENTLQELRKLFNPEDEVYVVGGAVRDFLLGKTPKDMDLVTTALTHEALCAMGYTFVDPNSTKPVYTKAHPTLKRIEVALARKESKTGPTHQDFKMEVGVTLEEDLRRRDFTINSMALNIYNGQIVDPFGGQKHLIDGVLQHTSEAFAEDALRVLRALRFSCKGFQLHRELVQLLPTMESELDQYPEERFFHEMMLAMKEEHPYYFFSNMVFTGVAKRMFKEIHEMVNVPAGPAPYHKETETVFDHCLEALETTSNMTNEPVAILASFLHDLGKVATPKEEWPKHHGHDERGEKLVTTLLERLKADNHTKKVCVSIAKNHMKFQELLKIKPSKRLRLVKELMDTKALNAMYCLMESDVGHVLATQLAAEAEKCMRVLKMSVVELGLDPEVLRTKPGEVIRHMVEERRIAMLKRMK